MDREEEERWKKWDEFIREQYPPGTRIKLGKMACPYAGVPPGTQGTVQRAASAFSIEVKWDNGSEHELIPGTDHFTVTGLKLSKRALSSCPSW